MRDGVQTWILMSIAGLAGAAFLFVGIADAVLEGGTHRFDTWLLLSLRHPADPTDPLGPAWFEATMRDITALGSTTILVFVSLAAIGYSLMMGMRHAAVAIAAATFGGIALSHALKWGFDRPRPDLVPHGTLVLSQSFPSGHAMLSAIVYLTLGAMLARTQNSPQVKAYLFALAAMLTLFVGVSRVYLGVHWPSDVLAGWSLGAAWALIWQVIMLRLSRRGGIEAPASLRARD